MTPFEALAALVAAHPTARIVTDVGANMFSGWGELQRSEWDEETNSIELFFD